MNHNGVSKQSSSNQLKRRNGVTAARMWLSARLAYLVIQMTAAIGVSKYQHGMYSESGVSGEIMCVIAMAAWRM